ncbi:hypothetical protein GIB67_027782 [Kingdonia uniflora]|uniref:Uncharacterized protein n=1 Tax=Kingdonia uniflora TaxID=39325 RepID=A0A7J7PCG2_9MAGN|nr:hypothetical protein GIB67_027782 [Kingdonia uniflora]
MTINETVDADEYYFQMFSFHCMYISGQRRREHLRLLAEEAIADEDEDVGVRARRSRRCCACDWFP